ncbi:hypothetical protein WH96_03780 [Kiloniella spongiae]|uniref:Uncharacterized protein n=1 Tax=Kiloniella spongiae TaxID=1489064 RepID=A0A0H2MP94_9PROT|nr:hypothetical protein [Kiloniella spongiae]KLN62597.1 hypothetical protein WH96_03780 [Kiloniella spongiae]
MDRMERIGLFIGMGLIVLGLVTLFDGTNEHSDLKSKTNRSELLSNNTGEKTSGPVLPDYDIILVNSAGVSSGSPAQSLSRQQEKVIRLALKTGGTGSPCDLQGKRPDRVLWGQRGNQKHLDSLSVFSDEKLIYLGSYLEAWKIQATGGTVTCYSLNDQAAKILTEL